MKPRWVVGILDRSYRPGRPVFKVVKNRSSEVLTAFIRKYVNERTTVNTDCWKGYRGLQRHNYIHQTVNHSRFYVDPLTGKKPFNP